MNSDQIMQVQKARPAINIKDTTTFSDESSKTLEYIYFGNTCDENNNIRTCNINFFIQDFNGQATIPTDNCQNALFATF